MAKIKEIWKDIEGYEGKYQVSSIGRVKSLPRKINHNIPGFLRNWKGGIVMPYVGKNGYYRVMFGDRKRELVHRLVAKAFHCNPDNRPCVNHKDGDPSNNHKSNLEWVTYSENELHSYRVLGKKPVDNISRFIHNRAA